MSKQAGLGAVLQEQGYRITPQRLLILEVIQNTEQHLSAEEVHTQVQAVYSHIDISTVYRTLELFTSLGLVHKTDLGEDHSHYEWSQKPHQHMVCQKCGQVSHFRDELLESVWEALRAQGAFYPIRAHVSVFGHCAGCHEARTASPS